MFAKPSWLLLVEYMSKAVLALSSTLLIGTMTSGCGSILSKPINFATNAVITPVKAIAGTTVDIVGKPLRKTAHLAKPVTPVIRVR